MFAFILSRGSHSTDCSFREKVRAELLWQERAAWIPLLLVPAHGPEERSATPPSPPPQVMAPLRCTQSQAGHPQPSPPAYRVPTGLTLLRAESCPSLKLLQR